MTPFSGIVWRILFAEYADDPLSPARAPEGRFHHGGQPAIYTSLTAEGAGVAIQRYLTDNDPPRVIVPLHVTAAGILDLRTGLDTSAQTPPTSVVWQDQRAMAIAPQRGKFPTTPAASPPKACCTRRTPDRTLAIWCCLAHPPRAPCANPHLHSPGR